MKRIFAVLSFLVLTISLATAQRLPETARPENYKLTFKPDLENAKFEGEETIAIRVLKPTSEITLNAVDIDFHDVTITSGARHKRPRSLLKKTKRWLCCRSKSRWLQGPRPFTLLTPASSTARCAASILAKTTRAASTLRRSLNPPTPGGPSLLSMNRITKPHSTSPPLPTKAWL